MIDDDYSIEELEYDKKKDFLQFCYRSIECDEIDLVSHTILPLRANRIVLIVDGFGVYKGLHHNIVASNLTSSVPYELRGKVMIAKVDGEKITGLSDDDTNFLRLYMRYLMNGLEVF